MVKENVQRILLINSLFLGANQCRQALSHTSPFSDDDCDWNVRADCDEGGHSN